MRYVQHLEKKKRKRRILRTILAIVLFLFLLLGTGIGYYASSLGQFFSRISDSGNGQSEEIARQNLLLSELKPFSVLLLGVDIENEGQQRTDTVMVATVNPEEESINLVSIPRDTPITLDNGFTEKINAMYQLGGTELAIEVVGDMFDIPISFYAIMDFRGLIELVDAVGGITVNSEFEFTVQDSEENSDAIEIEEGVQKLDGEHALGYARMRKQDPRGDFGRQERQQEVIKAVVDEVISLNTIANFTKILNAVAPYLTTDATGEQMLVIAANYLDSAKNINSHTLQGAEGRMYFPHYGFEVYVFEPYEESMEEISEELQNHLGIEPIDESDDEEEQEEEVYQERGYEEPLPMEEEEDEVDGNSDQEYRNEENLLDEDDLTI